MPPTDSHPHLSTLTLHQLRYGELDEEQERAARGHVDACPRCRRRLQAQQSFRAAFEVQPPAIDLPAATPASRWRWLRSWSRPIPLGATVLVAVALLVVVLLPGAGDEGTRLKGATDVQIIVEGRGALDDGETIAPGDRLQIRVPAGRAAEAWVGDGEELIGHFALQADTPTLSPFALVVDGEGGGEELVLILADVPITEDAARAALAGRRMNGVEIRRLWLPKGP